MKTIHYIPKRTNANTEYRKVQAEQRDYIIKQLLDLQQLIMECETSHNDIAQEFYALVSLRRPDLPKQGYYPYRQNSIKSFVNGIVGNVTVGTQYDFSYKTCMALEYIFAVCENCIDGYEAIKFVKVDKFPKTIQAIRPKDIDFQNNLFTIAT